MADSVVDASSRAASAAPDEQPSGAASPAPAPAAQPSAAPADEPEVALDRSDAHVDAAADAAADAGADAGADLADISGRAADATLDEAAALVDDNNLSAVLSPGRPRKNPLLIEREAARLRDAEERRKRDELLERRRRFDKTTEALKRGHAQEMSSDELANEIERARAIKEQLLARQREAEQRRQARLREEARRQEALAKELEIAEARRRELEDARERERLEAVERSREARAARARERAQKARRLRALERKNPRLNAPPLHERLEKQYQEHVVMPELERRRRQLRQLREQFQPIDFERLSEAEQRIVAELEERHARSQAAAAEQYRNLQVARPQYYRGRIGATVTEQLDAARDAARRAQEEKILARNRRMRYAAIVQRMFPPSVDEQKSAELKQRMEREHTTVAEIKAKSRSANASRTTHPVRPPPRRVVPPRLPAMSHGSDNGPATDRSVSAPNHGSNGHAASARSINTDRLNKLPSEQQLDAISLDALAAAVEEQSRVSSEYVATLKQQLDAAEVGQDGASPARQPSNRSLARQASTTSPSKAANKSVSQHASSESLSRQASSKSVSRHASSESLSRQASSKSVTTQQSVTRVESSEIIGTSEHFITQQQVDTDEAAAQAFAGDEADAYVNDNFDDDGAGYDGDDGDDLAASPAPVDA